MRKNFLKKKVKWNTNGEVILASTGDNLSKIVIQEGYGKVKGKLDDLKKLQTDAQQAQKGIFNPHNDRRDLPLKSDKE